LPKVNRLKALVREKQAKHKAQHSKNLPQHIIAVELGLDPATLSEYMNDKVGSISWELWQRMVNYFGVQGHEIFDMTPDKTEA
jgi:predicted transcriptional regulator